MSKNGTESEPAAVPESISSPQLRRQNRYDRTERLEARPDLAWHRAEPASLRMMIDFLARRIDAAGDSDRDLDVVTDQNLAIEAVFNRIRRGASGRTITPTD